jgi:hypothetical protein
VRPEPHHHDCLTALRLSLTCSKADDAGRWPFPRRTRRSPSQIASGDTRSPDPPSCHPGANGPSSRCALGESIAVQVWRRACDAGVSPRCHGCGATDCGPSHRNHRQGCSR